MPLAPRVLAQQSTATRDDRLSWVGCQLVAPHTPSRKVLILPTPYTTRTGDMHDPATQLPRTPSRRSSSQNYPSTSFGDVGVSCTPLGTERGRLHLRALARDRHT